jgi:predicted HTH domain antitoxin
MGVFIPHDVLQATRMTAEELRQKIAVLLFQKENLTLSQASHLGDEPVTVSAPAGEPRHSRTL